MRILLAATFALALLVAGCSSAPADTSSSQTTSGTTSEPPMDHSAKVYQVDMAGNAFSNATMAIKVGDQVTWTHKDGPTVAHTVTSDDAANPETFDSNPNCVGPVPLSGVCMVDGESYSHVFQKAGTYKLHCKVHSGMTQTITVASHNMTGPGVADAF